MQIEKQAMSLVVFSIFISWEKIVNCRILMHKHVCVAEQ